MPVVTEQSWAARTYQGPATDAIAVTPNDTANTVAPTRALWFGVGGSAKVTLVGGNDVTFAGIPDGTLLPIAVTRVFSTGSSGIASVLALY